MKLGLKKELQRRERGCPLPAKLSEGGKSKEEMDIEGMRTRNDWGRRLAKTEHKIRRHKKKGSAIMSQMGYQEEGGLSQRRLPRGKGKNNVIRGGRTKEKNVGG